MSAPIALALLSGGLDSLLAALAVRRQGVEVRGVIFDSGFFSLEPPGTVRSPAGVLHPMLARVSEPMAQAGIPVELIDVFEPYLRLLTRPAHGFGSALNPCIDCKILFLTRARERLAELGGGILVTGEVVGQRPMSQNAPTLNTIERESGCRDLLLRPLSALRMPPTRAEREGWIDRAQLFGFSGRTRKPQLELAARWGLSGYSQPAGGCILTEESFERRWKDYIAHRASETPPGFPEVARLRLGRHFRLPGGAKVIVGRDAAENAYLERYRESAVLIQPAEVPGPVTLLETPGDPAAAEFALGAAARYTNLPPGERAEFEWTDRAGTRRVMAAPLADEVLQAARI